MFYKRCLIFTSFSSLLLKRDAEGGGYAEVIAGPDVTVTVKHAHTLLSTPNFWHGTAGDV